MQFHLRSPISVHAMVKTHGASRPHLHSIIRPRPKKPQRALAYLDEDLFYRRQKELRFLHKLIKWPEYSSQGRIVREWGPPPANSLDKSASEKALARPVRKRLNPGTCSSAAYNRGFRNGINEIRARLLAEASDHGADLKAAARFNAKADMKRNLSVWCLGPEDLHLDDACLPIRWYRKGKQGEFYDFVEKDIVFTGRTSRSGGVAWVEIKKRGRSWGDDEGETAFYQAKDKRTKALPPYPERKLGQHNGSDVPLVYQHVSTTSRATHIRAKLLEMKALEKRNKLLVKTLCQATEHGYSCKRYGRTQCKRELKEISKQWPQHCRAFDIGLQRGDGCATEVFGAFNAALVCGRLLGEYLGDGPKLSGGGQQWREPLEMNIASYECGGMRDGLGDT